VFPRKFLTGIIFAFACVSSAQENRPPQQNPQVKVHMLNVCTPSAEDQHAIAAALSQIPHRPSFSDDFEIDRGRSVLDPNANPLSAVNLPQTPGSGSVVADFVRLRHDLTGAGTYSTVQYSFSRDREQMVETLVFRVRDPKDLLQVSIDDSASSVTRPAAMLSASTPAARIKLERFGKSSVVLARCSALPNGPAPDQSAYEPLFASASTVLSDYRTLLGTRSLIPEELARIGHAESTVARRSAGKRTATKPK
jgi:hypothetical protein